MLLLWLKVDSFIPIILPNLNPICHLLALGAHHILHVGRIRVNIKYAIPNTVHRAVHMGLLVDTVAWGQTLLGILYGLYSICILFLLWVVQFFYINIIPSMLHSHMSFVCCWHYIISAIDNVRIKWDTKRRKNQYDDPYPVRAKLVHMWMRQSAICSSSSVAVKLPKTLVEGNR